MAYQPIRRDKPKFKPEAKVLIICEDTHSSKIYLEDAKQYFRINPLVKVTHCGKTDPKNIVLEAISYEKKYDKIFCVIDRDTHETFNEALKIAQSYAKIDIVASYPCFEFWLLLHFGYNRSPFVRKGNKSAGDCVVAELKKKPGMTNYDKGSNSVYGLFTKFERDGKFSTARQHAAKVQLDANSSNEKNPSTEMHGLMNYFEQMSMPIPIDKSGT